jgi:hypothetical protein
MQNTSGFGLPKAWLDSFVSPSRVERFENTAEGIAKLGGFVRIHQAAPALISRFDAAKSIQPTPPPSQNQQPLSALAVRIRGESGAP